MEGLSVVIIAYNEEKHLETIVAETKKVVDEIGCPYELIIANDGSQDGTGAIINRLVSSDDQIKGIQHKQNLGMGATIHDGYKLAENNILTYLPADGQIPPAILKDMYKAIEGVDFVTTVYTEREDTFIRKCISAVLRIIIFILFGRFPRIDGIYMFRRQILSTTPLISSSFVFNFEIIIKAFQQGYHYNEVKMVCLPRESGHSKIAHIKKICQVLNELILLRWRMWQRKSQNIK